MSPDRVTSGDDVPQRPTPATSAADVELLRAQLAAYRTEAQHYAQEIAAIRERFLVGRTDEETFTVGELRKLFRDGPAPAAETRSYPWLSIDEPERSEP